MLEAIAGRSILNQTVKPSSVSWPIEPDFFSCWAKDYYNCRQQINQPGRFSPVPYFLLCRAIELSIKAKLLRRWTQDQLRCKFRHDLVKAYKALDSHDQILSDSECSFLKSVSSKYSKKAFEYFNRKGGWPQFQKYPDLGELGRIAKKLIG